MGKYTIGIDFGTLSGRAVLVDIETGEEKATSVCEYAHGIMSQTFLDGKPLPPDYALQHPGDYLEVLSFVAKDCIEKSGISPDAIIGVGVDFTSSTILPVTKDGTPLCFLEKFKQNPHAYVKLWKHHGAQADADKINRLAKETGKDVLARYGGILSCESMFPKILEILREDEAVYAETFCFIEAGDWIVWKLTGRETHSVCTTGFKAMWDEKNGYPDKEFLKGLDGRLETLAEEKLGKNVLKLSEIAGYITKEASEKTGIPQGVPVKPAIIDAHAALPALGITGTGELLMIIGTSTCHILLGDKEIPIPGIAGVVKDGIIDGLYAYEAGQTSVGDSFAWFVENCVPHAYYKAAEELGMNIHTYLRQKAEKLPPGANGVLAIDWWNGNRTPYVNGNLSGVLVGLTMQTRPEEIYRAMIEATAYGTRRIIEIYEENGIHIEKIFAAGGIAEKDSMLMQIYADVTGREIRIAGTSQACAYGSAVLGAANKKGYKSLTEAAKTMKKQKDEGFSPCARNHEAYTNLYNTYKALSAYFAEGENRAMEILKNRKGLH